VVITLCLLIGIAIVLGWNRQLIAAVHELRMTRAIRERSGSYDVEL
jgi:hypothetical protein